MRYGDTDAHSYGFTDGNCNIYTHSHRYTSCNSDADADSAATDTYRYSNRNGNTYGDSYGNANRKPSWECMSAANDDRPYQGSQHTVQFHGAGECD